MIPRRVGHFTFPDLATHFVMQHLIQVIGSNAFKMLTSAAWTLKADAWTHGPGLLSSEKYTGIL